MNDFNKPILIKFFLLEGHPIFICAVNGKVTIDCLEKIEKEANDYEDEFFDKGDGGYTFECQWVDAQYGDYGRIEIPSYWELSFKSYEPISPDGGDCE